MNEAVAPAIDCDAAAALLESLTELVIRAGRAILAVDRSAMKVGGKADGSPVTEADLAADRIIIEGLARLLPGVPVVVGGARRIWRGRPARRSFFLVDPLDGTKEFVAGRNEFTVNLALVTDGTPLLGIVGAPALGLIWRGIVGRGAERPDLARWRSPARSGADPHPPLPAAGRTLDRRRSAARMAIQRTEAFIAARPGAVRTQLGSAVKFGRVAEGAADIYPRLSPTCEWDVAAGHAVVTAAGGKVTDSDGRGAQLRRWRRISRAGIHRLGRSGGGALRSVDLLRQRCPRNCRPARSASSHEAAGIGGEGVAVSSPAEQIEPLARRSPRTADCPATVTPRATIDRIVAAELRPVDFRMGDEGGAVALVAEAPDRARLEAASKSAPALDRDAHR